MTTKDFEIIAAMVLAIFIVVYSLDRIFNPTPPQPVKLPTVHKPIKLPTVRKVGEKIGEKSMEFGHGLGRGMKQYWQKVKQENKK